MTDGVTPIAEASPVFSRRMDFGSTPSSPLPPVPRELNKEGVGFSSAASAVHSLAVQQQSRKPSSVNLTTESLMVTKNVTPSAEDSLGSGQSFCLGSGPSAVPSLMVPLQSRKHASVIVSPVPEARGTSPLRTRTALLLQTCTPRQVTRGTLSSGQSRALSPQPRPRTVTSTASPQPRPPCMDTAAAGGLLKRAAILPQPSFPYGIRTACPVLDHQLQPPLLLPPADPNAIPNLHHRGHAASAAAPAAASGMQHGRH